MKIRFDTSVGVDTRRWECLLEVYCTPEHETTVDLLEQGWLFDPLKESWYMSRSVRINLAKWTLSKSGTDNVRSYDWEKVLEPDNSEIETLVEYRRERGIVDYPHEPFRRLGEVRIERGLSNLGDCWYMTVHSGPVSLYPVCAFRKSGTRTSPGKACWTRACQVSKERGSTHLYVYEGYGSGAAYKAGCRGFEWWDGSSWSEDSAEYLRVLKNDSVI